jgi:hypothetical protein
MEKKEIVEDLVNMCKDSYNLIIQGNFNGAISDDISEHLKMCLKIIEACTVKEANEEN